MRVPQPLHWYIGDGWNFPHSLRVGPARNLIWVFWLGFDPTACVQFQRVHCRISFAALFAWRFFVINFCGKKGAVRLICRKKTITFVAFQGICFCLAVFDCKSLGWKTTSCCGWEVFFYIFFIFCVPESPFLGDRRKWWSTLGEIILMVNLRYQMV